MDKKTLDKARFLENDIYNLDRDCKDMMEILSDFDKFGSEITFKRNKDGNTRSFGSKKYNFKEKLREVLETLYSETQQNLVIKKRELKAL